MKPSMLLLTVAAVLIPIAGYAQQPMPTQPPQVPQPCVIPTPPPTLPKGIKPRLPKWLQQQIAKQQQRIEQQTGIHVDPNQIVKDATAPKPCPVAPVTQPKPQQ